MKRRAFSLGLVAASCAPRATSVGGHHGLGQGRMDHGTSSLTQHPARTIAAVLDGMATRDGAGVSLTRVIGQPALRHLDPFLMLDRFASEDPNAYIAGFPDHPHRGFETITVMIEGRMRHRDSRGNSGLITGNGIQWMTAGRGIVHSEMPEQDHGLMSGFQLWINLPREEKMCAPFYQDMGAERIAETRLANGGVARVIAGDAFGVVGPVRPRPSEPQLFDLRLAAGEDVDVAIPKHHNGFAFVYGGSVNVSGTRVGLSKLAVFSPGQRGAQGSETIRIAAVDGAASVLVATGKPFYEPIVQYGPFVMNTQEEIQRAFYDYHRGVLGHD